MAHVESRLAREAHQALLNDVRRGHNMRLALAAERQIRTAAVLKQTDADVFAKGGLGVRTMTVDPVIYWEMVRRFGAGCWRDKQFRKDMLRDHPELAVHARSRKITARVDGRRDSAGARTAGGLIT